MTSAEDLPADDADWTWVLTRPCPDCGFECATFDVHAMGAWCAEQAATWSALLARSDARVRTRPDRWSVLEYGCHVRDVLRLATYRVGLMLADDGVQFANWDQDETARAERYGEQDPAAVADELRAAAHELAATYEHVGPGDWERRGLRGDGSDFTIESFTRYLAHDPAHHVWDVR